MIFTRKESIYLRYEKRIMLKWTDSLFLRNLVKTKIKWSYKSRDDVLSFDTTDGLRY